MSSFLFFRFSSNWERERERGYIKLGIRRNGLKVYLSFFFRRGSCGEYFLFYRLIDFMLFLVLAWRKWLLHVRDIFLSSSTRGTWLWFCPPRTLSNNWFSYYLFPLTGSSPHFRFGVPANHLASLFFLPVSGDPSEVTKYKHLVSTVTHILS